MVGENFQIMILGLLENVFVSQKIESIHFYLCPLGKSFPMFLWLSPRLKKITYFSQAAFFENLFSQ